MVDPIVRIELLETRLARAERYGRRQRLSLWLLAAGIAVWNAAPPTSAQGSNNGVAHRVAALEATVAALESSLGDALSAVAAERAARIAADAALQGGLDTVEDLLAPVSRTGSEMFFSGVNLHIVNGEGRTDSANGLGNVIVGYNEERLFGETVRTGSHNLVIGSGHNFTAHSGIASGWLNNLNGDNSVVFGFRNSVSGHGAGVLGGNDNRALGDYATVGGGIRNHAEGLGSAIMGGDSNFAMGPQSTIIGGASNLNEAHLATIGGGYALLQITERGWAAGGIYTVPTRGPGVFFAP